MPSPRMLTVTGLCGGVQSSVMALITSRASLPTPSRGHC